VVSNPLHYSCSIANRHSASSKTISIMFLPSWMSTLFLESFAIPIEASSHYTKVEPVATVIPAIPPSGFYRIPLEIREEIYRMLLTTSYCTHVDATGQRLEFRLHTAILLVNKQISTESARVFYDENQFIVFKVSGHYLCLQDIPSIKRLSEDRVKTPLLQVAIDVADESRLLPENAISVITTSDGMQSVLSAIWNLEKFGGYHSILHRVHHGHMKISLNFNLKTRTRYKALSNLVLKPWETLNGIKELILSGDIEMPMAEHLKAHMLHEPYPNEVTECIEQHRLLAEEKYQQEDYPAARLQWAIMCDYWCYLYSLRPYNPQGDRMLGPNKELWHALKLSFPAFVEGRLGKVKAVIHQSRYMEAFYGAYSANIAFFSPVPDMQDHMTPLMAMKFALCRSLALTALGETESGMENLGRAAACLFRTGRYVDKSKRDCLEELKSAVNNELIQRKLVWRCGYKDALSAEAKFGEGWEFRKGCRSFWEWLDEPEDVPEMSEVEQENGIRSQWYLT
jgi:hypothetical protein